MRRSTRVSFEVPITVISLNPKLSYRETGKTLVVNLHGCGVQLHDPLPAGTRVRVEVQDRRMTGRVVEVVSIEDHAWMVGVSLDQPGNIWGVRECPRDWDLALGTASTNAQPTAAAGAPVENFTPRAKASSGTPVVPTAPASPAMSYANIAAQFERLERAHAEFKAMLQEERASCKAAREAGEKAIAEQCERVRQVRAYVESLACSLPSVIKTQTQEQGKVLLQEVRGRSAQDVSGEIRSAANHIEITLREALSASMLDLRHEMLEEITSRLATHSSGAAADVESLQAVLQQTSHQLAGQLNQETAAAVAELHDGVARLMAEQQHKLDEREKAGIVALQNVAGKMLATVREQLETEIKRRLDMVPQNVPAVPDVATLDALLAERARQAIAQAHQEFQPSLEEGQRSFEAAQAAAGARLQQLERRAETITATIDAELRDRANAFVAEFASRIGPELEREWSKIRAMEMAQTQAEFERAVAPALQRAEHTRAELAHLVDEFHAHREAQRSAESGIRQALQEAEARLESNKKLFEQALHEAFIEACGQIRGRIKQAMDMSSEPLTARSRELQEQLAQVGRSNADDLQRTAAQLQEGIERERKQMEAALAAARCGAEDALQRKVEGIMQGCRAQLEDLSRASVARWQSAMNESLTAMRRVLAAPAANAPAVSAAETLPSMAGRK